MDETENDANMMAACVLQNLNPEAEKELDEIIRAFSARLVRFVFSDLTDPPSRFKEPHEDSP